MKVKFLPKGIELDIEPNQSVMELAHKNGIFIKSICNGVPSCAECRVKIVEGEYNVLPPSSKELTLIGSGHFIDQRRLSCQLHCYGDVVIDLSEQEKKENEGPPGSRRFQVDLRNEGIVSKAVTGNLIQQDKDIVEALDETGETKKLEGPLGEKGNVKEREKNRSRHRDKHRRDREEKRESHHQGSNHGRREPSSGNDAKSRVEALLHQRGEGLKKSESRGGRNSQSQENSGIPSQPPSGKSSGGRRRRRRR